MLLHGSIALLGFEALSILLMISGVWFPSWTGFVALHTITVLAVSLTAALVLTWATRSGRIDVVMTTAFAAVLLAFNPLTPLDAVAFRPSTLLIVDLLALGLFMWTTFRQSA